MNYGKPTKANEYPDLTVKNILRMVEAKQSRKGTYCLRCGEDKKGIEKGCSIYGTYYKKHIYK